MEGNEAPPEPPEDVFMEDAPPLPPPQHPHDVLPEDIPLAQLFPPIPPPLPLPPQTVIRVIQMGFNNFCLNPLMHQAI